MSAPLLLIDANSFFYRAFHAVPMLNAPDGTPVNAIHGVLSMVATLIHDYQPSGVAMIFDAKGKNFRHELFPDYKAHRSPMPDELRAQIEPLHHLVQLMGLPLLVIPGIEADDVIATLATQASAHGQEVVIATGDKDLCQLVNEQVRIIDTMKNKLLTPSAVTDKFGVPPEKVVDWLTLVGDKSDNIPGVDGVGEKTAAKLLRAHGTLTGIVEAMKGQRTRTAQNILAAAEQFPLIQQLVITKRDCDLPLQWNQLNLAPIDQAALRNELQRLNLKRVQALLTQFGWLSAAQTSLISESEPSPASTPIEPAVSPSSDFSLAACQTISDLATWQHWLATAQQEGCLCFDLETTGLNSFDSRIVGIGLMTHTLGSAYLPLAHHALTEVTQLPMDVALNAIKPLLEDTQLAKLGHNLKYDRHILLNHGISLAGTCDDTMLESYIVNATASRHNMDDLAQYYLGHTTTSFEDIAGKGKSQLNFADIALDVAAPYACEDVAVTHALHQHFQQTLNATPELKTLYETIERPLMPIIGNMERTGVKIDTTALMEQSAAISDDISHLELRAHNLAGQVFNLGSSSQLASILFDKMGLPVLKKTPSGKPSTNEEVLEQLAETYELPAVILEYRSLSKLKSTYLDALPQHIQAQTGRVHSSFHQAVTATGRLSSSDPNLQNIPVRNEAGRRIRKAFIAETGYRLLAADYSQIELRLMAHLSQDAALLKAFANNIDVHTATAAEVFDTPLEAVTKEQRRAAKAVNFGLIYGMSAFGLAKQLGVERNIAQHYIDTYFARYPGVAAYMAQAKETARAKGYVETIFHRRLYLPDIQAKNAAVRAYAERTAINAPLQGSAADLIKLAMIRVDAWLSEQCPQAKLIMQVHDELVLEVPEADCERVASALKDSMEQAAKLTVPLLVELGQGKNWDEAK
ncbi:MAG: DNA polymerase I [Gammaproteobacteria bacterium]|nr:DNA polymerase I [Gammaproteobacteria bacterium]